MPRQPRLFIQGIPLHIVQRGHNRKRIFDTNRDYEYYLRNMKVARELFDISLYAYCLMTNHVHLLLAPRDDVTAVSGFIRMLAGRQTRHFNKRNDCTGTLWESRFKASLVDTDNYLLSCYRYVELNPVRAGLVSAPAQYPWSSYTQNAGLSTDFWLDRHSIFESLGPSPQARAASYRQFVADGISESELKAFRTSIRRNQVTGSASFRAVVESASGRPVHCRGPGRPRSR